MNPLFKIKLKKIAIFCLDFHMEKKIAVRVGKTSVEKVGESPFIQIISSAVPLCLLLAQLHVT
jgi:hypothetical protein